MWSCRKSCGVHFACLPQRSPWRAQVPPSRSRPKPTSSSATATSGRSETALLRWWECREDPMTYYAGAASGGIWKTTDGGEYWEPVFDDQTDHSVGAMAVAPSDPAIVWAGTGEPHVRSNVSLGTGVYKSTDAGATWRHMGLGDGGPTRMSRIVIHPQDPDIVYVGALGHAHGPQQARGVFRTMDGGESWEHVLFVDENTGASSIEMDPSNPRKLFAGMWTVEVHTWGPGERRRGRRHLHVRRRRGHVDETRGRRVAGAAGREDRHLPDPGGSQPGLRAHRNGRRRALARARDRERRVLALARRGLDLGAHEPLPRPGRTHRLLQQLFRQPRTTRTKSTSRPPGFRARWTAAAPTSTTRVCSGPAATSTTCGSTRWTATA